MSTPKYTEISMNDAKMGDILIILSKDNEFLTLGEVVNKSTYHLSVTLPNGASVPVYPELEKIFRIESGRIENRVDSISPSPFTNPVFPNIRVTIKKECLREGKMVEYLSNPTGRIFRVSANIFPYEVLMDKDKALLIFDRNEFDVISK